MRRSPRKLAVLCVAASLAVSGVVSLAAPATAATATTRSTGTSKATAKATAATKRAATTKATGRTGRDVTPTTARVIYQGPVPGVSTVPPMKMADFVAAHPFLTVLARAIDRAGLKGELNKRGPYTLFAPDDAAFGRLTKAQLDSLFADKKRLRAVLLHLVGRGQVDALTLITQNPVLQGLDGKAIKVVKKAGVRGVRVDGALLIGSNLVATNGLVHLVDTVIGVGVPPVPPTTTTPGSATTTTSARPSGPTSTTRAR